MVPVGVAVRAPGADILPYEMAEELVRSRPSLSVSNCICRQERKIAGAIGTGMAKFMLALGKAQGAQIPKELEGGNPDHLKQEVLLVISREPKVGRPTRASFSKEVLSSDVQAVAMVLDTYTEMLIQLGVKE